MALKGNRDMKHDKEMPTRVRVSPRTSVAYAKPKLISLDDQNFRGITIVISDISFVGVKGANIKTVSATKKFLWMKAKPESKIVQSPAHVILILKNAQQQNFLMVAVPADKQNAEAIALATFIRTEMERAL